MQRRLDRCVANEISDTPFNGLKILVILKIMWKRLANSFLSFNGQDVSKMFQNYSPPHQHYVFTAKHKVAVNLNVTMEDGKLC